MKRKITLLLIACMQFVITQAKPESTSPNHFYSGSTTLTAVSTEEDPFTWQERRDKELEAKSLGRVDDVFMSKLIDMENAVTMGEDVLALTILKTMLPETDYEYFYIRVFSILLAVRLDGDREMNSEEYTEFIAIAERSSWDIGPSIYTARAIAWVKYGLHFVEELSKPTFNTDIQLKIDQVSCQPATTIMSVKIRDKNGTVYADSVIPVTIDTITGMATIEYRFIASLPTGIGYSFVVEGSDSLFSSSRYRALADWICSGINVVNLCEYDRSEKVTVPALVKQNARAFPNPPVDNIIHVNLEEGNYTLQLIDGKGNEIQYSTFNTGKISINTLGVETGLYNLRILNGKGENCLNQKVLISK
ncbi:MAG: T9SS type A sorting domain-containing protein [Bacteroidota bacterium]